MDIRWIGAVLIITGCGGYGFMLCANELQAIRDLRQLVRILEFMMCEIQFHMTPLPEVCLMAGKEVPGPLSAVFIRMGQELSGNVFLDASSCMASALSCFPGADARTHQQLKLLGTNLGRFDLDGQLKGLESVRDSCRKELELLEDNRSVRLRSYQTLGLCAGAALAILLV